MNSQHPATAGLCTKSYLHDSISPGILWLDHLPHPLDSVQRNKGVIWYLDMNKMSLK
jgi:hypothetical protein